MTDTTKFLMEPGEKGNLNDLAEQQRAIQAMALAKEIGDKLHEHYPGYPWAVSVNNGSTQGTVNIYNWALSQRYGYVLHLTTVQNDPTLKCVLLAGGELLERGRLLRGEAQGEYAEVIDGLPDKHQPIKGIIQ